MCDPVTATVVVLSMASTYMAHESQVDAAENQSEALSKAENLRQMDMERQMNQQAAAATDEMNAAHRAALSDMATLDTIAGEYGGGNTATRGRAVAGVQQGEGLATIAANARNGLSEIGYAAQASRTNSLAQIRSIQTPSQVGTLLAMGSQAAAGANASQQNAKLDKLAAAGKTPPIP